ncbi:MAG TPA: molecular chaperone Tir [Actinobacteria bacterium]|nr:hypothetical protein BMS3Bbin01_02449 [bacterium BMS3Bbin01]HDH25734.1 molecular chaperone Tir [Actinomycetota bacterium]
MAHKCFISFKTEDQAYKSEIQNNLPVDMIDKSLDVPINSDDEDYILQKIRDDYLSDSTVTIHLIGTRSAEDLGSYEQRFIKRELQASLYDGAANTKNGILGVVLPSMSDTIYGGPYDCSTCGGSHNLVRVSHSTVVAEFSYNYYIPNGKCAHTYDERYCVLVPWRDFRLAPDTYIDKAFDKRTAPIAAKTRVRP